jgi:TnsA endonuclease N terminal
MLRKPFQSGKPVRKVVTQCSVRVTGRFASRKMGRMIPWESQIERDFILLAEVDASVTGIHAQPFEIEIGFDGAMHRYTPDFLLETIAGTEVHEIKPDADLTDDELRRKLEKAGQVIAEMGHRFVVTPESFIRIEPRLGNAKQVDRAAKFDLPPADLLTVKEVLEISSIVSIGDLVAGRFGNEVPETVIHGLIGRGELQADLNRPLGFSTLVYRSDNPPGIVTTRARQ